MAALNLAVMIPGLVIVIVLFWAWIPILILFCCIRRATGKRRSDEELQIGHVTVPHKGFAPPRGAHYEPYVAQTQFVSETLQTGKHHSDDAANMKKYEQKHGRKTDEALRQKQLGRQERNARRERKEKNVRGKAKEAGRESSVSVQKKKTPSNITVPEKVVNRDSGRRQARR